MLEGSLTRTGTIAAMTQPMGLVPKGDYKRAGSFKGLRDLIARKGGDPIAVLDRFGIDASLLDDEEAYLPYSTIIHLIEHCAESLDQPYFGFELAMGQTTDVIGPLAILLLASPTVEQGLVLVARYLAIHAPGARCYLEKAGNEASLAYVVLDRSASFSRQINEFSMAIAFKTLQAIVGGNLRLNAVDISGPPPARSDAKIEEYFGATVYYDRPVTALRFPAQYLQHKVDTGNPLLLRFAQAQCDALIQRDDQMADVVAGQIRRLLPMGGCSLQMVARQLSMHPRSLQNRLTAEGLEFREIMRSQRQELAQAYLAETRTPIAEVAILLGYSDQAAFTRAFSTWQGQSPRRYREAQRSQGSARSQAGLHG